jgi:apolipoprotein N-acyltransferase
MTVSADGRRRWAWLAVGVGLLLLANGRWIIAPAAWLALPGWLVFVGRSRPVRGLTIAFVAWLGVFLLAWRGIVPAPGWMYLAITGTYALVYFVPVAAHRLVASRLAGEASTLVFPLAWVGVEFAFQRWVTPYGSWMSIAYSQTDLSLLQSAALTGTAGISFLVTWLASSVAVALRADRGERRWRLLGVWAVVFSLVLGWGEVRLFRAPEDLEGIRTASIMPSGRLLSDLEKVLPPIRPGSAVERGIIEEVRASASALNDDLLRRTVREARAGARLVAWSETAGRVLAEDEGVLLERASRIAAEESTSLVLAYGVWHPGGDPPLQNKVAAIGPDGAVAWHYEKSHPIVGPESPLVGAGEGRLLSIRIPAGTIGAAICHDLDFPDLLRQAARKEIGLVVGPSYDWSLITDIHGRMARVRAIESGFTLLRPTYNGRTLAVDPWGRTRASVDHPADAVVAHVPVLHLGTVFGSLGNWLGWASLVGVAVLTAIAARRTEKKEDHGR